MIRPLDFDYSFRSLIDGLGTEARTLWDESPEKFMGSLAELSRKIIVEKVRYSIVDLKEAIASGEKKLAKYKDTLEQYEAILKHYDTPPSTDNT